MSRTASPPLFPLTLFAGLLALAIDVHVFAADDEAPPDATTLINGMSRAMRELDYDGVFIYRRNRQIESMRLLHKSDTGGERERLVSLTGLPREVIRNDKSVTCIFPEHQSVMVENSGPRKVVMQLPEPIESIARHYLFSVDGEDRVAGREAWMVSITPRDAYRYGYHFWIDKDSDLLLRSELRNQSGLPLEEIMFTQLQVLESLPDELLLPSISGQDYTWYHNAAAENRPPRDRDMWRVTKFCHVAETRQQARDAAEQRPSAPAARPDRT